ncbi:unnamed protein product [Linum trigynum]|uniref:Glycosyltransferase N-terminal domain-containing protein n=1 Tax=Linum trigynum TaxID=586398 RepID=A0AAV2GIQ7_9ROSI
MAQDDTTSHFQQLHIFFVPFMARGHMIPFLHMAKFFASKGIKSTIITTKLNHPFFAAAAAAIPNLETTTIPFPAAEDAGLPPNCESMDSITSRPDAVELAPKFFLATASLRRPLESLLETSKPDCLVADMFFPWSTAAAARFGIPRLVFHGTGFFSLSAAETVGIHEPHKRVSSDSEPFLIPNLPGQISMTRKQLPEYARQSGDSGFGNLMKSVRESELKSYGVIVNSFYELETDYADYYRSALERKAWHIGPLSLCNNDNGKESERGKRDSNCLKWLDGKRTGSVIYVCFGSMSMFAADQLREIAIGLEASGEQFVWAVRKDESEDESEWLPQGFEARLRGRGLIVRGWAPQVAILEHQAVGGFVTHCGWNSTLEGVAAGKAMVTWPMFAEQFYNEKLVTEVLRIGVAVGATEWVRLRGGRLRGEDLKRAVRKVMDRGDEEAGEMRERSRKVGEMARRAVGEGGSSWKDLNGLIDELRRLRSHGGNV